MSARVRVRRSTDGRLVAVKVGLGPADDFGLVHEAAMLAAARHPGVVRLVGLGRSAAGLELMTCWIGGRSLADVQPLAVSDAAGVVGALAATVADLHRHGIVHGAIEPTHVLLDQHGRPVLCSLGNARFVSAASASSGGCRPADDVAALGALLAATVGLPTDPELIPRRRFTRRGDNHLHRSLLTTADHAQADDPAARPSAASLAGALAALAPQATLPVRDDPGAPGGRHVEPSDRDAGGLTDDLDRLRATAAVPRPRRARWPFVTVALAVPFALVGATTISGTTPTPSATATPPVPSTVRTTAVATSTTAPSDTAAPVVRLGDRAFDIGQHGDRVIVGPWRCDGVDRALLLRPATGEVFLFDEPPPPGGDRAVGSFARYVGATDLMSVAGADNCPTPTLLYADGRVVALDVSLAVR